MFRLTLNNIEYYRIKHLVNIEYCIEYLSNIENKFFDKYRATIRILSNKRVEAKNIEKSCNLLVEKTHILQIIV